MPDKETWWKLFWVLFIFGPAFMVGFTGWLDGNEFVQLLIISCPLVLFLFCVHMNYDKDHRPRHWDDPSIFDLQGPPYDDPYEKKEKENGNEPVD